MTPIGVNRVQLAGDCPRPGNRIGTWDAGLFNRVPRLHRQGDVAQLWMNTSKSSVGELLDRQKGLEGDCPPGAVDGVTISKGEPFDQVEALEGLLLALRQVRSGMENPNHDFLVHTSYEEAEARRRGHRILSPADGLIVRPHRVAEPGHSWWGSANQPLSVRNQADALPYESASRDSRPAVQVSMEEGQVFPIGVPGRKTPSSVEKSLEDGIKMGDVSWRP